MKFIKEKNKKLVSIFIIILVLGISLGYALLSSNLNVNGTAGIDGNVRWSVYFDNINNIDGVDPVRGASINTSNGSDTVSFEVSLSKPGDYYSFTVDAINDGSIDAMVDTIAKSSLSSDQMKFLEYSVLYSNGNEIHENDLLPANGSFTYKVMIKFKDDITKEDLSQNEENLNLNFSVTFIQADDNAVDIMTPHVSFHDDSWDEIVNNIRNGYGELYQVGDTKEIQFGGEAYTVRLANTSTSDECSSSSFSQTSCGFVIEFVDAVSSNIIINNSFANDIEDLVYYYLPNDLKNVITDTYVVYGNVNDYYSDTKKIFRLSPVEVYGNIHHINDYSSSFSRQLDFYSQNDCFYNNCSVAIKNYDGQDSTARYNHWWLRSIDYSSSRYSNQYEFFAIDDLGALTTSKEVSLCFDGNDDCGLMGRDIIGEAPAFRIG